MKLNNSHKAALITALIAGVVVLFAFNIHLKKRVVLLAETFYELPSEQEKEEDQLKEQARQERAETNKAFNETQKSERFDKAYSPIAPPKAYKSSRLTQTEDLTETAETPETESPESEETSTNSDDVSSFNKVNSILNKTALRQQKTKASNGNSDTKDMAMNAAANKNSSMHYSLVDRTHMYLPTPIYLCEASGKIVVNITVNASGKVIDTYINTSSTSKNECLIDSALEYAKKARFNVDASKPTQIGSITFYFEGKG